MFSAVDTIFRQYRSSNREIVHSTLIWSKVRFLILLLRPLSNKCVTFFSKGGVTRHGKTAVSHFSYNKIGISRITKKLTFFARIINLTIIKYFSQSNALFLILIIRHHWPLRKGNLVICLYIHALFLALWAHVSKATVIGLAQEWRFGNVIQFVTQLLKFVLKISLKVYHCFYSLSHFSYNQNHSSLRINETLDSHFTDYYFQYKGSRQ